MSKILNRKNRCIIDKTNGAVPATIATKQYRNYKALSMIISLKAKPIHTNYRMVFKGKTYFLKSKRKSMKNYYHLEYQYY